MKISVSPTELEGVLIIEPDVFEDERGFFFESYSKRRFLEAGLDLTFVQDNHSRSQRGVLRGFHYQDMRTPQFRLVRCTQGQIWDVVVDLRVESPTFGKWVGVALSAENKKQLLMGPEFAHGFGVLSEFAEVQYKCSDFHNPEAEGTLAWNDPDVGVRWPISDPKLSQKDKLGASMKEYLRNPRFHAGKLAEAYRRCPGFTGATKKDASR